MFKEFNSGQISLSAKSEVAQSQAVRVCQKSGETSYDEYVAVNNSLKRAQPLFLIYAGDICMKDLALETNAFKRL